MLKIESLAVQYGTFCAVQNVSLEVRAGEMVALIGANGAGKTTTINTVSGLLRPAAGRVEFAGEDITGKPSHAVCELGLIQVPEGRKIFPFMRVIDNLELGAYLPRPRARRQHNLQRVWSLFPRLYERRNQLAGTLSGGEQQMLALGRALMAEPTMIMLDEPTLGLSPKLASEILQTVKLLNRDGMPILIVTQEVAQALRLADRAYVMENGVTVKEGPASDILTDPRVRQAYLGVGG